MAINQDYYAAKISQITVILQLISSLKSMIIPVIQFVEDTMPNARGVDKLKAATGFIREAVADSEEISTAINSYWAVFNGAISLFAVAFKRSGEVISKPQ